MKTAPHSARDNNGRTAGEVFNIGDMGDRSSGLGSLTQRKAPGGRRWHW
jgi:hypothetical protein